MEVSETVLWFVVTPAVIVLVIGGLAYAWGGGEQRGKRYRPGRPYDVAPVWFLANPDRFTQERQKALAAKPQPPALATGEAEPGRTAVPQGATGGASDRW